VRHTESATKALYNLLIQTYDNKLKHEVTIIFVTG